MTITPIIGAKAYIILEEDTFAADPSSPAGVTPDTDPALIAEDEWRSLGCIVSNDYQFVREGEVTTYCPGDDGVARRRNTKHQNFMQDLTITLEDLTLDAWKFLFGISDLDGSFVGTPGSQVALPTGWLKIQHYDNTGDVATANVANMDVWCEFDVDTATTFSKSDQTQLVVSCNILTNGFNTIQLLNSATTGAEST